VTKRHDRIDEVAVEVRAGEFAMGSEDFYPDEAPVRRVSIDGFWTDPQPVTNSRFSAFVEATGFIAISPFKANGIDLTSLAF
jgi:formylglycine-generating enzyme required for sulfatase activity